MNLKECPNQNQSEFNWNKRDEVLRFFPLEFRELLAKVPLDHWSGLIEIRLRVNRPLELNMGARTEWLSNDGGLTGRFEIARIISPEELKRVVNSITTNSFYAIEEEIRQGYLALPGGHRVGFTGKVLHTAGKIRLIRNISSINFRIAKEFCGIARPVLPLLWEKNRFGRTIIIGPPASGKTTLLRDIIREVSWGVPAIGIPGLHVGLVDERSEIAGSYQGIAQFDLGPRTDVLDGCPKKEGVYLLLRAMNPQLIATDEIGCDHDFQVIEDIINAGVGLIATAHAQNLNEALLRPGLKKILEMGAVERIITLSNRMGIGTIESIKAGLTGRELAPKNSAPGVING